MIMIFCILICRIQSLICREMNAASYNSILQRPFQNIYTIPDFARSLITSPTIIRTFASESFFWPLYPISFKIRWREYLSSSSFDRAIFYLQLKTGRLNRIFRLPNLLYHIKYTVFVFTYLFDRLICYHVSFSFSIIFFLCVSLISITW